MSNRRNTPEDFYANVDKNGPNGCWSWLGSASRLGYGQLSYQGKRTLAHRVSYELNKGPIPDGLLIRHVCDNPNCCNPEHLLVGTHQDNADDKKSRGRGRGSTGAPSINPVFKTVTERETERYGVCEAGHILAPNNLITKVDGSVTCSACYWINRSKVMAEPITEAELLALESVVQAVKAALNSVAIGHRLRLAMALDHAVNPIVNEELNKRY